MVEIEQLIGVVSPSRLDTAQRCLAQFMFRYVEKRPERWRSSLSFGKACDATGSEVFEQKMKTAATPSASDVQDRFAAEWDFHAEAVEVWDEGANKGKLLDAGVRAVASWRNVVAAQFQPSAVQERVQRDLWLDGEQWTLQGVLDVRGRWDGGEAEVIADMKTAGKSYGDAELLRRSQPHAYTLLTGITRFEFHVLLTTKDGPTQVVGGEVPKADAEAWARRAAMTRRAIVQAHRTGDWLPNRTHFLCSRRHCDFWEACESTFGGRVAP